MVSPSQLRSQLEQSNGPRPTVVDARAERLYQDGHLPGSINVPARDLNPVVDGVRRLAGPERLRGLLAGLHPGDRLVIYGAKGGAEAAHLLWTLRALGFQGARLLDGGIEAWQAEGGELTAGGDSADPAADQGGAEDRQAPAGSASGSHGRPGGGSSLPARPHSARFVDREEIMRRLDDPDVIIVDTREPEEYRGELLAARRGGHIPGALLFPWTRALDFELRLRQEEELRKVLAPVLARPEAFVYCQSGIRAAHTAAVLEELGHPAPRLYLGSWGEWGNREDTPVETDVDVEEATRE